jgi:peptidyl-prolyl cis-trans isomerase D
MFEGIVKKRKKRVFNYAGWGLLAVVCGIFVFTGYSPNLDFAGSGTSVAQVNGEVITYSEFARFYERAQEGRESEKLTSADRDRLKREVVESMVNRTLILQAAKKQGISISAEEIRDYMMQIPQFQENGKFSLLRYKQLIKNQGMSEARFEEKVSEDLLLQKMNGFYMRASKDDKILQSEEDAMGAVKLNIQFIKKAKSDVVSDSEVSGDEIQKFIKDHPDKVSNYYKEHESRDFTQSEQVNAQHILIKTSPEVSEAQAMAKAKTIASEITDSNFSALAKKYSEDPGSKDKGGELGYFSRGRMAREFEDVAFSTSKGKVSTPFTSSFGVHILKVIDKKEPKTQGLEEVKPFIAKKLIKEEKMANAIKDITGVLSQGPDAVQKMLAQKGWSWEETGSFSINDMIIPKLGENDQVLNAALTLSEKNPIYKDVVETGGNIYLVKLKSVDSSITKDSVKALSQADFLKQIMERQQSMEMFQGWLSHLRKDASVKLNEQILSNN